jgi:hypothetical protein
MNKNKNKLIRFHCSHHSPFSQLASYSKNGSVDRPCQDFIGFQVFKFNIAFVPLIPIWKKISAECQQIKPETTAFKQMHIKSTFHQNISKSLRINTFSSYNNKQTSTNINMNNYKPCFQRITVNSNISVPKNYRHIFGASNQVNNMCTIAHSHMHI